MSHFVLAVIHDDEQDIDVLLAPYSEELETEPENPNAQWDWYEVGGRWNGYLRVNGEHVNEARIGEVDFSPDEEKYNKALRFWDVVVEHAAPEPDEEDCSFFNEKYYIKYYGDKENFARRQAAFSTHAVITQDGEWHERGKNGWFGLSDETPEESADWDNHYLERFINNADKNLIITIVDCHI